MDIKDDTPITWGLMRRALERAYREAGDDYADPHESIRMDTVGVGFARLEGALQRELEVDETRRLAQSDT